MATDEGTVTVANLEARVARGAALLDRFRPGWASEIAVDRLAMESCDDCILGQLYGSYAVGWLELLAPLPSVQSFSASAHGFTLREREQDPDVETTQEAMEVVLARFAALAAAWRAAIRARTEEAHHGR